MLSTRKSVSTTTLRSSSSLPRCSEATGLVKAPGSGVTKTSSTRSRSPCSRSHASARKVNSSGATGHLIGISVMWTTSRPWSNFDSASASASAPSRV